MQNKFEESWKFQRDGEENGDIMATTPVQETLDGRTVDTTKTRKSYTQEYKREVVKFIAKITCARQ